MPTYRTCPAVGLGMVLVCGASIANADSVVSGSPEPVAIAPPIPPMPTPFDGLAPDFAEAFTGLNLLFYGGALIATGAMAFGGADQAIRVGTQQSLRAPAYADVAYYAGYILPAAIAPAVYIAGLAIRDPGAAGAGSAALQALAITLLATGILKVATGRPYPLNGGDPTAPDRLEHPEYARTFHPFASAWPLPSWPSGHTSATTSVVAALVAYYPEEPWIPLVGYPLALGVGVGLVVGDRHWASDVVAGALLGHAIGYSVGTAFRRRVRGETPPARAGIQVVPLVGAQYCGAAMGWPW